MQRTRCCLLQVLVYLGLEWGDERDSDRYPAYHHSLTIERSRIEDNHCPALPLDGRATVGASLTGPNAYEVSP
jgi:hypothetical protein